jgi:hypothetical protein
VSRTEQADATPLPLDVIREAIKGRRHLEFEYRGLPRVVEPMTLGIWEKGDWKGDWKLRASQVGGLSATGKVGDGTPKLFNVALMSEVALLATTFAIPAGYERGDKSFMLIDTEL